MEASATLETAKKARQLAAKGVRVINLTLGEPDFNTPDNIKTALKTAVDDNYSHYTPVNGLAEVREAVVSKFKRDNQLTYAPNQIVLTTGAKQAIAQIFMAVLNPGDEVLLPAPFWVSYKQMIELAGGIPKIIETDFESDYKMTPKQLEDAIGNAETLLERSALRVGYMLKMMPV